MINPTTSETECGRESLTRVIAARRRARAKLLLLCCLTAFECEQAAELERIYSL